MYNHGYNIVYRYEITHSKSDFVPLGTNISSKKVQLQSEKDSSYF